MHATVNIKIAKPRASTNQEKMSVEDWVTTKLIAWSNKIGKRYSSHIFK